MENLQAAGEDEEKIEKQGKLMSLRNKIVLDGEIRLSNARSNKNFDDYRGIF